MFLSIFKLISLFFVTSVVVYFMYQVWFKNTKLWYKLSAIVLGAVAVGSFIAQLYISIPFMLLVPLPIFGLLMLVLAE